MKKLFLSLVVAVVVATATYAQNTLVATLTHGEDITMYYGTYALRDAYEAAVNGDVINLSGGAFQPVTITKAITLRGAGIDAETPTYILNNLYINIPAEETGRFLMEGVRCSYYLSLQGQCANPYFLKCQFRQISCSSDTSIGNALFADCKITESFSLDGNSSVQFVNCYVSNFINHAESASACFANCIITPPSGYIIESISNSQLFNSVIFNYNGFDGGSRLPDTSAATNCVVVGLSNCFASQANANCKNATAEELFKSYTGEYSDEQTFELTDAAKLNYLGSDGTQVGLYGGMMPYTSTPSYPQITKLNVANKTTPDGKLSVEIEVNAVQ